MFIYVTEAQRQTTALIVLYVQMDGVSLTVFAFHVYHFFFLSLFCFVLCRAILSIFIVLGRSNFHFTILNRMLYTCI